MDVQSRKRRHDAKKNGNETTKNREKKMQMQAGPHKMAAITIQREQHMPKKVCKKWRKRLKTVPRKLCV